MKNLLYFGIVSAVFILNTLFLFFSREFIGFGREDVAVVGLVLGFTGIFIWFWGYFSLGKSFSLLPRTGNLVKTGAYRFFKHPIYLGMGMTFVGLSLAKGSFLSLGFSLFVTCPLNYFRAKDEEKKLKAKFGKEY